MENREASEGVVAVRGVEEATWEREDTMCDTYPFLFKDEGTLFSHLIKKMIVAYVCDSVYMCV